MKDLLPPPPFPRPRRRRDRKPRPRLQCRQKSENSFTGSYRSHYVSIRRNSRTSLWSFLVLAPDGRTCADGFIATLMPLRDAIVETVTTAGLWKPNLTDPQSP